MGRAIHSSDLFLQTNTKTSVKCFTSYSSLVSPWPQLARIRTRWVSTLGCASTPWRLSASAPPGPPWATSWPALWRTARTMTHHHEEEEAEQRQRQGKEAQQGQG